MHWLSLSLGCMGASPPAFQGPSHRRALAMVPSGTPTSAPAAALPVATADATSHPIPCLYLGCFFFSDMLPRIVVATTKHPKNTIDPSSHDAWPGSAWNLFALLCALGRGTVRLDRRASSTWAH